ncbi:MAG: hypothetical protein KGD64_10015 [Candidatus Heimdallarchaeota archaeon]|nr:hypothetical protein [Candidatus Heimdallarchaeota archaeon]
MSEIEIHLYGRLRKLANNAGPTDDSTIKLGWEEDETIADLVEKRLNLSFDEIGEIFVNFNPIILHQMIIPEGARIALFEAGMYLLCGGQHMKGHGFITKKLNENEVNYY